MALDPQDTVLLFDSAGSHLGNISIERIERNQVFGRFTASERFDSVRNLFLEFEEAVNEQLFSEADRIGSEIDALGLSLQQADSQETLMLSDVQVMNGRDFTCRVPNLGLTHMKREAVQAG